MAQSPIIYALVRKHAEIGGRIKANRAEAKRLIADMHHVEAVLKLFDPDYDARKIAAKRQHRANPMFKKGEMWPLAIQIMKDSPEPLTGFDIAREMLRRKGFTDPTPAQSKSAYWAITSSLRDHAGKIVEQVGEGMPYRWRVIEG